MGRIAQVQSEAGRDFTQELDSGDLRHLERPGRCVETGMDVQLSSDETMATWKGLDLPIQHWA